MKKIALTLLATSLLSSASYAAENRYVQTNLVANKKSYKAEITDTKLINAWGISIRPAGAGGHFWVTGKDVSFEYVGDVKASADSKLQKLHTDDVSHVKLPVGGDDKFATGTVFSGSKESFVITQGEIIAPAKFLFASDGGIISAWTERKKDDGTFDRPSEAITVIDRSEWGSQFFGLAISQNYDRLYVADFGKQPDILVYDDKFNLLNIRLPFSVQFDQPFDDNKNGKVDAGEYAPFNIQQLMLNDESRIFVTYAKTQACPKAEIEAKTCKEGELFVGEEDTSKAGYGKLAEFDEDGKLIAVWNDGGKLSAPWGLAIAPDDFGALSGQLLVANFGDGTIAAYDTRSRSFTDYARNTKDKPLVIDKIWGLIFGNGASLGDANALYFAAGPKDEADGIFGSLRMEK